MELVVLKMFNSRIITAKGTVMATDATTIHGDLIQNIIIIIVTMLEWSRISVLQRLHHGRRQLQEP